MSSTAADSIEIPAGFRLHTENTSHILLSENEAFLNPVQEFNRDLSVACIRVWSEELNRAKEQRWNKAQANKLKRAAKPTAEKNVESMAVDVGESSATAKENGSASSSVKTSTGYRPYKFVILEALSATGLRSIRYAKEIPLVKYVIANDLSAGAVEAMKRNISINGFEEFDASSAASKGANPKQMVHINEGDACTLMYSHREEKNQVDVVDLDPYGTAAPFIDAAIQCVNNGGLLCVTCTDLSVLATTNYPEKCFSNYGGVPVKAEYCHESALRLLLHTLSTSASRYGRFIEPLLSLSIDFYVRVFIRIQTSPIEVKKALTKNSTFYICSTCQTHYEQPLGRVITKTSANGNNNYIFKTQAGPLIPSKCPECESTLHVAGPMWSGPLHNKDFVGKVLTHVGENEKNYNTSGRMKGMLTVAKEELENPFYFTPSKVASFFHCETPSLDDVASALLNAGHKVSRSHACAGSLKTDASHRQLHDIYRSWIKLHPVKLDNISETSPARRLLSKESMTEADFKRHPQTIGALETIRLVRYQENPAGWGPGKKASAKVDLKRKRSSEVLEEPPAKH
ncbi:N2,N2-dimethylguanosine tRNA methyltransferase [Agrocybe pediades]|nr:N2,N2-dimethylguanosine tRNA methyltransferase [Agrocybe pediades]